MGELMSTLKFELRVLAKAILFAVAMTALMRGTNVGTVQAKDTAPPVCETAAAPL
jgi:hypothetical protein